MFGLKHLKFFFDENEIYLFDMHVANLSSLWGARKKQIQLYFQMYFNHCYPTVHCTVRFQKPRLFHRKYTKCPVGYMFLSISIYANLYTRATKNCWSYVLPRLRRNRSPEFTEPFYDLRSQTQMTKSSRVEVEIDIPEFVVSKLESAECVFELKTLAINYHQIGLDVGGGKV